MRWQVSSTSAQDAVTEVVVCNSTEYGTPRLPPATADVSGPKVDEDSILVMDDSSASCSSTICAVIRLLLVKYRSRDFLSKMNF